MKINEIIQDDELLDVVKHPEIVDIDREIDKTHQQLSALSDNFTLPNSCISQDSKFESIVIIERFHSWLNSRLPATHRLQRKVNKLLTWLDPY